MSLFFEAMYTEECTVNSEISRELYFPNSVKRHIHHIKNLRLGQDLPTSVKRTD